MSFPAHRLAALALAGLLLAGGTARAADPGAAAAPDPRQMILERTSPLAFEATVAAIQENAKRLGWVVSGVRKMDESVAKNGGPKVRPVTLVELCNAQHAGKMLLDDASRFSSVMMPCTISVYEKADGKVVVGFMNARLVGKMFGGTVGEVMGGDVASAQDQILAFLKP